MKKIAIIAVLLAGCLFVTDDYVRAQNVRRSESGHAFSGRVVRVDVATRAFSLKDKGNTVGFDVSNPSFSGYRSLSAVHVGDRVAVSYTADGIRIAKLSVSSPAVGGERLPAEKRPAAAVSVGTRTVGKLIKMRKDADGTGFSEADVNKDGRITPVELSIVIKDITMDEFRQCDRNHHGYLGKAEFLDAVKHLKTAGR